MEVKLCLLSQKKKSKSQIVLLLTLKKKMTYKNINLVDALFEIVLNYFIQNIYIYYFI